MAYDHARKAGNKGDVWKHFTLVTVVDRLDASNDFRYIDVHSGAPSYELGQTGEWKHGIAAVLEECASIRSHGYLQVGSEFVKGGTYPSAWRFVVDRLSTRSAHVEVVLTDTADRVAAKYKESPPRGLPPNTTVCFRQEDGFRNVESVTRAGLVLIDPPFNPDAAADWKRTRVADCHY
jgi:23S rRNA A2030 N6-methylase RlmJ